MSIFGITKTGAKYEYDQDTFSLEIERNDLYMELTDFYLEDMVALKQAIDKALGEEVQS